MRLRLKCGGHPRKKALFGADGAITAAATLAAAAINAAATASAAKTQAKAVESNAKTQAESIKAQTANNNSLQQESINFTRQQNKENRDQQQEIQTTLQMMAGQENMNDRMEKSKVAVKYGGSKNNKSRSQNHISRMGSVRRNMLNKTINAYNKKNYDDVDYDLLVDAGLIPEDYNNDTQYRLAAKQGLSQSLYGGAIAPFKITDGGGVVPLNIDSNGYGLYEIYGNDHEHYHKTQGGKYKSGVGFKFPDGTVIEGEGNQNTNKGEKVLITPNDAMFISKHSIGGFNPSNAVDMGMNPIDAFVLQEQLKSATGIKDDGSKQQLTRKRGLAGLNVLSQLTNQSSFPNNGTVDVASGAAYAANNKAKYGMHRQLKCGGRAKAAWGDYAGATYNAAGNLIGAGINTVGNYFAGRTLSNAYQNAGNILANAYDQMTGIDMSEISREDYAPAHAMAVVRSVDSNINPTLERIRRNAEGERTEVNENTMSSAARQQRLQGINDRMLQRTTEAEQTKHQQDDAIARENAANIQEASETNAKLDSQANQQYASARLNLLQYNNNIENAKIAGKAQALADAGVQSSSATANAFTNSASAIGSAIAASGNGFSEAFDAKRKMETDIDSALLGASTESQVTYALQGHKDKAKELYDSFKYSDNENYKKYAALLNDKYKFDTPIKMKDMPGLSFNNPYTLKWNFNIPRITSLK